YHVGPVLQARRDLPEDLAVGQPGLLVRVRQVLGRLDPVAARRPVALSLRPVAALAVLAVEEAPFLQRLRGGGDRVRLGALLARRDPGLVFAAGEHSQARQGQGEREPAPGAGHGLGVALGRGDVRRGEVRGAGEPVPAAAGRAALSPSTFTLLIST